MEQQMILTTRCCDINILGTDGTCLKRQNCSPHCRSREMLVCGVYFALQVAQNALKERHSVDTEINDFKNAFFDSDTGGIFLPTLTDFEVIRNTTLMFQKITEIAKIIIGEHDPVTSSRTFGDLIATASAKTPNSNIIDIRVIEALEGSCGHNKSGRGCDVTSGACSCGAWH